MLEHAKPLGLKTFAIVALTSLATFQMAHGQSLGAFDPNKVGRNYQSLDQIYAIAPAVVQGRHKMSQAQSAPLRATAPTPGSTPPQSLSALYDQQNAPIVEPLGDINWVWMGTALLASAAGTATYLIMRPN